MALDFFRCRLPPFAHQREDVAWLMEHPHALIASEMRTGKSKIVVDASQFLFEAGIIDRVIVVAPAPVRDVWFDPTLGEIAKHAWIDVPNKVTEFHARLRSWSNLEHAHVAPLKWIVSNFEFLRSKNRLTQLLPYCGPKTLLVGDESSFLKNHAAQQTKAFAQLRKKCGRVWLLNGTPIFHSPMDLFSQANILSPTILESKFVTHFRATYAVTEPVRGYGGRALTNAYGKAVTKIVGWRNLDDLQRRFAPVTVRRLQKDCLDLPPKLDAVTLTAELTPATWKVYKDMRDELVVWFGRNVATAQTAATKVMRLSQITSGFLGGVEDANIGDVEDTIAMPGSFLDGLRLTEGGKEAIRQQSEYFSKVVASTCAEIGREKLDVLLWFLERELERSDAPKVVAWTRFRAEMFRVVKEVKTKFPQFEIATICGGQKRAERLAALALLKPETSPDRPIFVCGIEGTGSFGIDMTASHTCVTLSSGYSPGRSAQTLDRVYGPGQIAPIAYYDIIATGPGGRKTIDHAVLAARRAGEDVASWTASAWVKALKEE